MMKVTWLGEEGAPDEIQAHGFAFKAGKAVDVPEEVAIGQLLGNPFFKIDDGKGRDVPANDNQPASGSKASKG